MRVLLLGGTTEASQTAAALAAAGVAAIYSYAGRTATPVAQPLPTRIGGFGGVAGMVHYLREEQITHVIDATHAFAAQISRNAARACSQTGTKLIALERAAWVEGPGDDWCCVADIEAAVAALPDTPARVFLAIGRQNLAAFSARPQHFYLLRLVDAPVGPLPLPNAGIVLARGPFTSAGDLVLLRDNRISHIVAKNAGGEGARAKLDAARILGLPVILIARPPLLGRHVASSVHEVMRWLLHPERLGV